MRCSLRLLLLLLLVVVRSRMKLFIEDAGISVGARSREAGDEKCVHCAFAREKEHAERDEAGKWVRVARRAVFGASSWNSEDGVPAARSRGVDNSLHVQS